jgi:hypothetical protein
MNQTTSLCPRLGGRAFEAGGEVRIEQMQLRLMLCAFIPLVLGGCLNPSQIQAATAGQAQRHTLPRRMAVGHLRRATTPRIFPLTLVDEGTRLVGSVIPERLNMAPASLVPSLHADIHLVQYAGRSILRYWLVASR